MDVRQGQQVDDNNEDAEQYFPHPSPVVPSKKTASLWSFMSSFTDRHGHNAKDDKRRSWKTRESSDTLLPTTYSNTDSNVVKGGSTNVGNLHQRSVAVGGSAYGDGGGTTRRKSKGHHLQPHNAASNSPVHNTNNTSGKTWSSLLLGGQYYPGKDKKRRAMRRRTLWYRIFCSSPPRKFMCWILALYLLGYCLLLPLLGFGGAETEANLLWRIRSYIFGGSYNDAATRNANILDVLQYDTSLQLLSLRQEQIALHHIQSERSRLQVETKPIFDDDRERNNDDDGQRKDVGISPRNARQQILERIAPLWFHRNDGSYATHLKQQNNDKLKRDASGGNGVDVHKNKKHRSKMKPTENAAPKQGEAKATDTASGISKESQQKQRNRILTVTSDIQAIPQRTIHNMQAVAANHSSCNLQQASDTPTTTLVIQTSLNRLWILKETCRRWNNPITAVVFIPRNSKASLDTLQDVSDDPNCSRLEIIKYMASEKESISGNYPVNRLRNIGLDHVTTSHILVMDVDFVPSKSLDRLVGDALMLEQTKHSKDNERRERLALIVPAFERQPPEDCETEADCAKYLQQNSSFLPQHFDELRACYRSEDCIVFQSDVNVEGHSTTRSHEWIQKKWYDQGTAFRSVPCFHTARYEPYVVLEWCPARSSTYSRDTTDLLPTAPYYDERFHGYGKNKIELISHLRKSGYRFRVLPEGFIIHNPHPESSVKETWNDRDGSDLHRSMDTLYSKFLKELDLMYADVHNTTIKLCSRS